MKIDTSTSSYSYSIEFLSTSILLLRSLLLFLDRRGEDDELDEL